MIALNNLVIVLLSVTYSYSMVIPTGCPTEETVQIVEEYENSLREIAATAANSNNNNYEELQEEINEEKHNAELRLEELQTQWETLINETKQSKTDISECVTKLDIQKLKTSAKSNANIQKCETKIASKILKLKEKSGKLSLKIDSLIAKTNERGSKCLSKYTLSGTCENLSTCYELEKLKFISSLPKESPKDEVKLSADMRKCFQGATDLKDISKQEQEFAKCVALKVGGIEASSEKSSQESLSQSEDSGESHKIPIECTPPKSSEEKTEQSTTTSSPQSNESTENPEESTSPKQSSEQSKQPEESALPPPQSNEGIDKLEGSSSPTQSNEAESENPAPSPPQTNEDQEQPTEPKSPSSSPQEEELGVSEEPTQSPKQSNQGSETPVQPSTNLGELEQSTETILSSSQSPENVEQPTQTLEVSEDDQKTESPNQEQVNTLIPETSDIPQIPEVTDELQMPYDDTEITTTSAIYE